ncbi:MAG: sterol desaturase family protein [Pseudomonadota bacterium]|nr:sterol desaturase family protein [Pseudomonadota bacterium]
MPINRFLYFGDYIAIPVALAVFFYLAFFPLGLAAAPEFLVSFVAGLIVWTLAEYWIHRVLYHHAPLLMDLHNRHHEAPKALIGIPSFLSCGIVIALGYAPFCFFAPVFADGFASGCLIGYAAYMVVHHATHHWRIEPGHWLYRARLRHLSHHYHDDVNFGIVTGVWDRVFGTDGRRRGRLAGV